jgi:hypothetical protein
VGKVEILSRFFYCERIKNPEVCRRKKAKYFYTLCYHEAGYNFPTSVNFRYENIFSMGYRLILIISKRRMNDMTK